MTDMQLQNALNRFVALGNKIDAEAKRRYGREGLLFHEADGAACIMDRLPDAREEYLSAHVKFIVEGVERGAGAF